MQNLKWNLQTRLWVSLVKTQTAYQNQSLKDFENIYMVTSALCLILKSISLVSFLFSHFRLFPQSFHISHNHSVEDFP